MGRGAVQSSSVELWERGYRLDGTRLSLPGTKVWHTQLGSGLLTVW